MVRTRAMRKRADAAAKRKKARKPRASYNTQKRRIVASYKAERNALIKRIKKRYPAPSALNKQRAINNLKRIKKEKCGKK